MNANISWLKNVKKLMIDLNAISGFLGVSESDVLEVEEWANVVWVKALINGKLVCRFISKQIAMTENVIKEITCHVKNTIVAIKTELNSKDYLIFGDYENLTARLNDAKDALRYLENLLSA